MPRRQIVEDPVSHERWLVSYADFITLLFAFFVVMYSISQVNEGKYRILSSTLTEVFSQRERSLDPIQIGQPSKARPLSLIELNAMGFKQQEYGEQDQGPGLDGDSEGGLPNEFRQISQQILDSLSPLLAEGKINVQGNEQWLEIELASSLLFASGDDQLGVPAMEVLGAIAASLRQQSSPVRVEGFTDNVPINSARFSSNWQLSTARALAVVRLFEEEGIAPQRLAAIGYGEHQPIADNDTAEGRERNRRVVLMISRNQQLRPQLGVERYRLQPAAIATESTEAEAAATEQPLPAIAAGDTGDSESPEPAAVADELVLEPLATTPAEPQPAPEPTVQTILLEGGGLLFTSEPRGRGQPDNGSAETVDNEDSTAAPN